MNNGGFFTGRWGDDRGIQGEEVLLDPDSQPGNSWDGEDRFISVPRIDEGQSVCALQAAPPTVTCI